MRNGELNVVMIAVSVIVLIRHGLPPIESKNTIGNRNRVDYWIGMVLYSANCWQVVKS